MELTLSVRSFQVPATPGTAAWPPSLPSVPTSRATRVTSEVKALICSIMVLTMVAERRNSPLSGRPFTSRLMVCCRSPLATAEMVRVTSVIGHSRSSISVFTEASIAPQAPGRRSLDMRWRVLPSLPTICPARSSSPARRSLEVTISLNVSAILPASPVWSPASRTEKSPSRTACSARSSRRRSSWLSSGCWLPLPRRGRGARSWVCISELPKANAAKQQTVRMRTAVLRTPHGETHPSNTLDERAACRRCCFASPCGNRHRGNERDRS